VKLLSKLLNRKQRADRSQRELYSAVPYRSRDGLTHFPKPDIIAPPLKWAAESDSKTTGLLPLVLPAGEDESASESL
jgi:hypothetical protein